MMLQSLRFTLVTVLLNALDTSWHTTNPTPSDSAFAPPGLLYVTALTRNKLNCCTEDRHKHEK